MPVLGNNSEVAQFKEFHKKILVVPSKNFQYFKVAGPPRYSFFYIKVKPNLLIIKLITKILRNLKIKSPTVTGQHGKGQQFSNMI